MTIALKNEIDWFVLFSFSLNFINSVYVLYEIYIDRMQKMNTLVGKSKKEFL